jgi:hypothetical protein
MERRLMLSATIGDTPAVQIPTIDPTTLSRTLYFGSLSPTDGGFVLISPEDNHGTSVAGIIGASGNNGIGVSGVADQDSTPPLLDYGWDLLNTGQVVGNPDLQHLYDHVYTNADQKTFTSWASTTLGIKPISMILVYAPGSELPVIGGSVTTPAQAIHSSLEGGSISIGSLLTSAKQEQSISSVEHGIAPVSNTASELRHVSHANAAFASSIAGEWARPAAFETVGSERGTGNRDDADGGHGVSPVEESAIESGASAEQTAQPKAAKTDADRTSMEETSASAQEHQLGHRPATGIASATVTGEPNGSEIVRALFAGSFSVASSGEAGVPIPIDGELGASMLASEISQSRAAAFDEIGRTGSLIPIWQKSRAAAALVSILALERIAELNGRNVERESSDPAVGTAEKNIVVRQRIRKLAGLGVR